MPADDIESLLRGMPTRDLGADRERAMVEAILTASAPRRTGGSRTVPLWPAVAACILVAGLAYFAGSVQRTLSPIVDTQNPQVKSIAPEPKPDAIQVHVSPSPFVFARNTNTHWNIATWGPLPAGSKETPK